MIGDVITHSGFELMSSDGEVAQPIVGNANEEKEKDLDEDPKEDQE